MVILTLILLYVTFFQRVQECSSKSPAPAEKVEDKSNTISSTKCHICDKVFKRESHLNQHMKVHDNKQWECDVCKKTFTTKYFLKKHKRLHTGKQLYQVSHKLKTKYLSMHCQVKRRMPVIFVASLSHFNNPTISTCFTTPTTNPTRVLNVAGLLKSFQLYKIMNEFILVNGLLPVKLVARVSGKEFHTWFTGTLISLLVACNVECDFQFLGEKARKLYVYVRYLVF